MDGYQLARVPEQNPANQNSVFHTNGESLKTQLHVDRGFEPCKASLTPFMQKNCIFNGKTVFVLVSRVVGFCFVL